MRDEHHRSSAHLSGRRRRRGAFISELFAHPLKDPFGDGEFIPLGSYLRQLLGQLFLEFVQLRRPRDDPFQQLGIHVPDRRRPPGPSEQESTNRPAPSDDLLLRQQPQAALFSNVKVGVTAGK
ncbi:hypothetical protein OG257_34175 [Streptomyces sp. NBC_00683]|uniref:hypothetical protein n=1 Tax=Streptomyces sp. NBC_00683 TaxID=2903670 RepID=UPI002E334408|nr:hypothetical protein [Streptomyces sp. NBC_00683]